MPGTPAGKSTDRQQGVCRANATTITALPASGSAFTGSS